MLVKCSQMLVKCKNAKYESRAFKRTIFHAFWTKIHRNIENLICKHFCIFGFFCKNQNFLDENMQNS